MLQRPKLSLLEPEKPQPNLADQKYRCRRKCNNAPKLPPSKPEQPHPNSEDQKAATTANPTTPKTITTRTGAATPKFGRQRTPSGHTATEDTAVSNTNQRIYMLWRKLTINWDMRCLIAPQKQSTINIELAARGVNTWVCLIHLLWGLRDNGYINHDRMDENIIC